MFSLDWRHECEVVLVERHECEVVLVERSKVHP